VGVLKGIFISIIEHKDLKTAVFDSLMSGLLEVFPFLAGSGIAKIVTKSIARASKVGKVVKKVLKNGELNQAAIEGSLRGASIGTNAGNFVKTNDWNYIY
jgi:hypothetical protein